MMNADIESETTRSRSQTPSTGKVRGFTVSATDGVTTRIGLEISGSDMAH